MAYLNALQECRERMAKVMNKRVEFEMTLIKICGKSTNVSESIDNSEIYDKIKHIRCMKTHISIVFYFYDGMQTKAEEESYER